MIVLDRGPLRPDRLDGLGFSLRPPRWIRKARLRDIGKIALRVAPIALAVIPGLAPGAIALASRLPGVTTALRVGSLARKLPGVTTAGRLVRAGRAIGAKPSVRALVIAKRRAERAAALAGRFVRAARPGSVTATPAPLTASAAAAGVVVAPEPAPLSPVDLTPAAEIEDAGAPSFDTGTATGGAAPEAAKPVSAAGIPWLPLVAIGGAILLLSSQRRRR